MLVIVATPFLWQIDLESVRDTVQLELAVQKPCFLRRLLPSRAGAGREGVARLRQHGPGDHEENGKQSSATKHGWFQ
jgi:hypothetical protein